MHARTKYLLAGLFIAVMAVGALAPRPTSQPSDPVAATRSALALIAVKTIKDAAKDPDSIEFISLGVNEPGNVACAEYRGRNSFNAKVKSFTVFVNGLGSTGNVKAWNQHCTKPLYDQMPLIQRF
jgi:hypothetical protein